MPFAIDLAKLANVNLIGEALRDYAFMPDQGYGAYSNHDLRPEFKPVERTSELGRRMLKALSEEPDDISPSLYSNGELHVGWYCDGDVVLMFMWDDVVLINTDAKKDDYWHLELPSRFVHPYAARDATGHEYLAAIHHPVDGAMNACMLAIAELLNLEKFDHEQVRLSQLIDTFARIAALSDDPSAELERIVRREIEHLDHLITRYPRPRDVKRFSAARALYAFALDRIGKGAAGNGESWSPQSLDRPTPEQAAALRCIAIAREALMADGATPSAEVERRILEEFGLGDAEVACAIDTASGRPADEIAIPMGGAS